MQEFQKLITPGHVAGHRVRAAMRPFYTPALVSYGAGIVLALSAISGVGGHALTMPAWFDRAFTADEIVYQRAADARAQAALAAAEARKHAAQAQAQAQAASAAQASSTSAPATQSAAPAPVAAPAVPVSSPAVTAALASIGRMSRPENTVQGAAMGRKIDEIMTGLVNDPNPTISSRVTNGYEACGRRREAMFAKLRAAAPDHIVRGSAQLDLLDFNRTCVRDLLTGMTEME
ncbi:hypothetical protein AA12717_3734 [Gluconacetobacter sacchari DSM 12717]|uniref:Uncharacterized protein n=2 Tax=Gluconacetobacter sacchari TaxID=92759 RepID=A0A7W4NQC6_9PROT|nr:hypothetical protein [Gluconacetobacter sacchari]MBB2158970.1 hypothetical protein [Gluconacetobacter sacchari]GBQ31346.1 hypothetical protein AA12717_3734 [Gluconacetobacter sacchari DSM 12717]